MEIGYTAKRTARRLFFGHTNHSDLPGILLVSTRRSGSTWLAELIARSDDFCLIDQPFSFFHLHDRRKRLENCYEAGVPRFTDPEVRALLCQELTTYRDMRHPPNANWLPFSGFSARSSRVIVKELDAKFIAGEPALRDSYKVIVLMRSAADTVRSILRNNWGDYLDGYLRQPAFVDALSTEQRDTVRRVAQSGNAVDRQFLSYCLETIPLQRIVADERVAVVQYERLRAEPAQTLRRLAVHCAIPVQRLVALPTTRLSRTSRKHSASTTKRDIRKGRQARPTGTALQSPLSGEILTVFGHDS